MIEDVIIEPMTEEFIVWRCLHHGPLSPDTISQWSPESKMPWAHYRDRNTPLLLKLTRIYGACAIIARDADRVVGQLRFYPKVVCGMKGAGGLCLQQDYPEGPVEDFADSDFPDPAHIEDKTIAVHCLMTGSPHLKENHYQRKGIGTRMVQALIQWARANTWEHIEADSFEDLAVVYEITGSAGHTFWEKIGFYIADRHVHPDLEDRNKFSEFIMTLEKQAEAAGIPPERATDRLIMRFDLV